MKLYGWVLRGSQRRMILQCLNRPKSPTLIKEETKIKFSNVSDVLRAMEKVGVVECLNPSEKMGRLYQLTGTGTKIKRYLEPESKTR